MDLYGKNAVRERLRCQPQTIDRIILKDNFSDSGLMALMRQHKIPHSIVPAKEWDRLKSGAHTQGIIAKVRPFIYADWREVIDGPEKPTLLFLDKLQDPQNLGTILRTAACFGNIVVCLSKHQSCDMTEAVLHVASGADNYVPVVQVSNIINTLVSLKKEGYWVAGTLVDGGKSVQRGELPFPLAIVMGSEGEGLGPGIQKYIDLYWSIPMPGAALSLNVAMAAGIVCYEVTQQRKDKH